MKEDLEATVSNDLRPATHPSATLRALAASTVVAGSLFLVGCSAPGMKLNVTAGQRPTTTHVDGLNVTLRSLDPQAVRAQATRFDNTPDLQALLAEKPGPYLIGPQDILLVTVWEHPEISQPLGQFRSDSGTGQLVDEEGNMYFPYVGVLQVRGLTAMQVRAKLFTQLAKVLKNPQIDVKVQSFRSQKVYVGGEVHAPGVYNITDVPFTLSEALGRAGGVSATGDDSRLILTRGDRSWSLNYFDLMAKGSRYGQILLKDGDSLRVLARDEETVYLLGELKTPRPVPLIHGHLSLARALSEAGGMDNLSANAHSVYVIRGGGAENAVDVYHLDARNPASMVLADRFALQPRDIVYVDSGTLVRWNRVLTLLVPTYTTLLGTATDIKYLK